MPFRKNGATAFTLLTFIKEFRWADFTCFRSISVDEFHLLSKYFGGRISLFSLFQRDLGTLSAPFFLPWRGRMSLFRCLPHKAFLIDSSLKLLLYDVFTLRYIVAPSGGVLDGADVNILFTPTHGVRKLPTEIPKGLS